MRGELTNNRMASTIRVRPIHADEGLLAAGVHGDEVAVEATTKVRSAGLARAPII